jgi:hypothetical protein
MPERDGARPEEEDARAVVRRVRFSAQRRFPFSRRPRIRSGRSLRSLGSPLNARPFGRRLGET